MADGTHQVVGFRCPQCRGMIAVKEQDACLDVVCIGGDDGTCRWGGVAPPDVATSFRVGEWWPLYDWLEGART